MVPVSASTGNKCFSLQNFHNFEESLKSWREKSQTSRYCQQKKFSFLCFAQQTNLFALEVKIHSFGARGQMGGVGVGVGVCGVGGGTQNIY